MIRKTLKVLIAAGLGLGIANIATADTEPSQVPFKLLKDNDSVHSYILLDRTGSMGSIWDEALGSVNAYAKSVGEADEGETEADTIDTNITLAVFDHHETFQFDVLRKDVPAQNWNEVTDKDASPRGMTPLFDAIGRVVTLAEADAPEKAVIVIMTDGRENSSKEITKDGAKAALERAEKRGWEVVFLGADFASFGDAQAVGMTSNKTMALSPGRMQESMSRLAKKSRSYGKGDDSEIVFDEADREASGEDEVIQRKGQ